MAFAVLAASTAALFIRYAQVSAPSLVIAAYRLGIAAAILWPVGLIWSFEEISTLSRSQVWLGGLSGLFLAVHFGTWITSLEFTTVASSLVLVSMAPLFVGILAPITLGEPLRRNILIGLVLALAGTIVIGLGDTCTFSDGLACPPLSALLSSTRIKGDLLALLGAISVSGYMLIGRGLRPSLGLIPYITITYTAAALALFIAVIAAGLPMVGFPASAYLLFLLLALFPQLLAHSTYNWTLRYLPVTVVSLMLLAEPIASSGLAYFLLGEIPSGLMAAGGVLVLSGIAIAVARRQSPGHGEGV